MRSITYRMRFRTFLLLLLLLAFPSTALRAQTGAEKSTDSLAMAMEAFAKMMEMNTLEVKPTYTFEHNVRYIAEKVKWGEKETEDMVLYFNASSAQIAASQKVEEEGHHTELFMVFDLDSLVMVNFMRTDTMSICMPMRLPDFGGKKADKVKPFKATGKERTIAGMKSREWLSEDEHEETRFWIAESSVGDLSKVYKAFGKLHGKPALLHGDHASGLVLAGIFKRKDADAPYYSFEATEVKLNTPFTFSSEGYRRAQ